MHRRFFKYSLRAVQNVEKRVILIIVTVNIIVFIFVQIFSIMPAKVTTLKQLAIEYGVCRNTFRKWIKPIEKQLKLTRQPLRAWQVKMIFEFLDMP
jgi:hypothetical protein